MLARQSPRYAISRGYGVSGGLSGSSTKLVPSKLQTPLPQRLLEGRRTRDTVMFPYLNNQYEPLPQSTTMHRSQRLGQHVPPPTVTSATSRSRFPAPAPHSRSSPSSPSPPASPSVEMSASNSGTVRAENSKLFAQIYQKGVTRPPRTWCSYPPDVSTSWTLTQTPHRTVVLPHPPRLPHQPILSSTVSLPWEGPSHCHIAHQHKVRGRRTTLCLWLP